MQNDLLTSELKFSDTTNFFLAQAAKWARFLSVLGFIVVGLMVIMAFIIPSMMVNNPVYSELGTSYTMGMKVGMTVMYLIIALITFFPCLFLSRFGKKMRIALEEGNQESLEISFENLKSLFKFYGILSIVVLSFYALILILVLAGLAMNGV